MVMSIEQGIIYRNTCFDQLFALKEPRPVTIQDLLIFSQLTYRDQYQMDVLIEHIGSDLPRCENVVVIGRFQPFHVGHLFTLVLASRIAKRVTIGIGSANTFGRDNPFSAAVRERLVLQSLEQDSDTLHKIHNIVYLNDYRDSDARWLSETMQRIGHVDSVIGRNAWVNGLFEQVGVMPIEPPEYNRNTFEGSKIRRFLREKGFILEGFV